MLESISRSLSSFSLVLCLKPFKYRFYAIRVSIDALFCRSVLIFWDFVRQIGEVRCRALGTVSVPIRVCGGRQVVMGGLCLKVGTIGRSLGC